MIASRGGFKAVKSGIKPKLPSVTKALKKATWKATKKMGTKVGWPMLEHYSSQDGDGLGEDNVSKGEGPEDVSTRAMW